MEWEFGKSTKKCTACSKTFEPGEEYFSALFWGATTDLPAGEAGSTKAKEDNFTRKDYCVPCWGNKPSEVFSFWKTRIASKEKTKTPREVLIEFFDNLIQPEFQPKPDAPIPSEMRQKVIYLFSLILLRKKILKIKESVSKDNQPFIVFQKVPDGKTYEIPELTISEEELVSLREEFSRLFEFEI